VDPGNVQVAGEEQDVGSGVGSADADMVEAAAVADGDGAVGVDADAVVGVGTRSSGAALGRAAYAVGRGGPAGRERCGGGGCRRW